MVGRSKVKVRAKIQDRIRVRADMFGHLWPVIKTARDRPKPAVAKISRLVVLLKYLE